jgi:hypothetical protein
MADRLLNQYWMERAWHEQFGTVGLPPAERSQREVDRYMMVMHLTARAERMERAAEQRRASH